MDNDFETQVDFDDGMVEEKPDRRLWIILAVVLVVVCCCCLVLGVGGWMLWENGDDWFGLIAPVVNQFI